ncbi:MAG: hypothetical protein L3J93_01040 [Thermoplasmata archaeon]|nr:hypothetical protein [Thermoplasmata archaeon]
MPASSPAPAERRRKGWRSPTTLAVVFVLLLPLVLGVAVGWFEVNPVRAEMLSSVGSEAHQLLSNFPDSRLVVEFDYQASQGPPPASAISILEQRINATCGKTALSVEEHGFSSTQGSFSESDLLSVESSVRHVWPTPGTMAVAYLYLAGSYAPDSSTIGLAYRGSSIAVFEGTIRTNAGGSASAGVDTTVLVHEFGHELGLVGIYGAAPNEDANHPYHSNDSSDVMYWAVDSTALLLGGIFGGAAPPTQFDAADLADLANVRGAIIPLEVIPIIGTSLAVVGALALAVWGRRHRRS